MPILFPLRRPPGQTDGVGPFMPTGISPDDPVDDKTYARLSQEVVDVVVLPTSQTGRLSQEVVDVVVLPTSQKGRISQLVVEAIYPLSARPRRSVITVG